jgi:hypothetical protein
MDVGPFDDPVWTGLAVYPLRLDVHELKDRREFLHLRFKLGDALR